MGMAHREIVTHRNAIMPGVFVKHGIHIVEAILRMLVFVELTYDNGTNVTLQASNLDVMKHTIYLTHALACILDKQNDAIKEQWVEIRTNKVVEYRHIASNYDALSLSADV